MIKKEQKMDTVITLLPSVSNNEDHQDGVEPDVRETMAKLPFQFFWTWLTGKPNKGELPIFQPSPFLVLFSGVLCITLTPYAVYWLLSLHQPLALFLLPACWMMFVSGARLLQVTIVHHAVHKNFVGVEWVDRLVGQVITSFLLIQEYDGYQKDHVSVHHSKQLATLNDPDLKFLIILGFRPGMKKEALWRHLFKTLFSPHFHLLFMQARLRSNFSAAPLPRRIISWLVIVIYITVIIYGLLASPTFFMAIVLGWLFPLTIPYQISSLLQFSSEHRWLRKDNPETPAKLILARLTVGRFMGESAPRYRDDFQKWAWWWIRVLLIHIPARIFVLVGDLPQHDWHHRHPLEPWTLAAFSRQQDIDNGCPKWPESYNDVWGLDKAIDHVFDLWSKLPELTMDELDLVINQAEIDDVLTGM
jgi:hypothetical protein